MVHTAGVTVLGAGLTGAATALELASRGVEVTLVERDERPGNRASLRNEGKIHLGLLYANDRSLASAAFQLRGALCFRRLLTSWVGREADDLASGIAREFLHVLDDWYPGIAESEPILVDAGSILAWGHSDVNDPASALHDRSRVGVVSQDGYHSVEPGKLTTAPLVAVQAAAAVLGAGVAV